MEDILIPIGLFGMVLGIVIAVNMFTYKRSRDLQETVREAVRAGKDLSPELIRSLGVKPKSEGQDIKGGLVLIAIALGLIVLGWGIQSSLNPAVVDSDMPSMIIMMTGVAAIPGFIGVVLVLFGLGSAIGRRKD